VNCKQPKQHVIRRSKCKIHTFQAIKNKNFSEVAVAQGLLEVAKMKMENPMNQHKQCSNK